MMKKQQDTRLAENKIYGFEPKKEKVEVHITDNQPWNRCYKVASDHEFTFGLAIESTNKKHNVL